MESRISMQYAVIVAADKADALKIPGAKILERQEIPEDGTVGFIVDSEDDIRWIAIDVPGVIEIEPL
jgi:hypothetical protein